jgi:hypothetical protein
MSSKKTPKRQVPVDEVVHEFPETPVEPWTPTPVEPINVIPMPKPERAELPLSLATTIAEVIAQLAPGDVRDKLNANLMAGVQSYITAIKVEVAANSAREIAEIRDGLVRGAREQIDAKIAEITKASGPTNPQDMQKLVSQEYLKFPLSIVTVKPVPNEEPIEATVHFTIREMPQAQEKKLLEILTLRIPPMMKKFQGLKFTTGSSNIWPHPGRWQFSKRSSWRAGFEIFFTLSPALSPGRRWRRISKPGSFSSSKLDGSPGFASTGHRGQIHDLRGHPYGVALTGTRSSDAGSER